MTDLEEALDAYFAAYRRDDIEAILDWFALPCHFVSDADPVALMPLATREAARPGVERVLSWHRAIGATQRRVVKQSIIELSPQLSCVNIKVDLEDAAGAKLYDFEGVYTFVRSGESWRVAAITHNQIPRLLSCVRAREATAIAKSDADDA
jgi:hypothetical protein